MEHCSIPLRSHFREGLLSSGTRSALGSQHSALPHRSLLHVWLPDMICLSHTRELIHDGLAISAVFRISFNDHPVPRLPYRVVVVSPSLCIWFCYRFLDDVPRSPASSNNQPHMELWLKVGPLWHATCHKFYWVYCNKPSCVSAWVDQIPLFLHYLQWMPIHWMFSTVLGTKILL